jgi:hypothetical protein
MKARQDARLLARRGGLHENFFWSFLAEVRVLALQRLMPEANLLPAMEKNCVRLKTRGLQTQALI